MQDMQKKSKAQEGFDSHQATLYHTTVLILVRNLVSLGVEEFSALKHVSNMAGHKSGRLTCLRAGSASCT